MLSSFILETDLGGKSIPSQAEETWETLLQLQESYLNV